MGKITVVDIVLRLLGAVIVGFAVGAQRARTSHPAGIRTHILVALGSCVVMVTSCILYEQTIAVLGQRPLTRRDWAHRSSTASVFWVPVRSCVRDLPFAD